MDGGSTTASRRAKAARGKRAAAPTTVDPIEIALEAAEDEGEAARRFLRKQEQLVGWQIASERAGFVLKGLAIAGILLAVVGLGVMAWSAWRSETLVIDAFSVPAELAQSGATGEAVASQLKDKFLSMSEATIAGTAVAQVQQARAGDVQVEIAGTGVSFDQLDRLLRARLGRETHVAGEVSRVTTGPERGALAISLRVGGNPGERLVEPSGDLDALLARAAERALARRDPRRYGPWLVQTGRWEEARAYARGLTMSNDRELRAIGFFGLSGSEASVFERRALLRRSVQNNPNLKPALNDLGVMESALGHTEAALGYWRKALTAPALEGLTPGGRRLGDAITRGNVEINLGNYAAGLEVTCVNYELSPCTGEAVVQAVREGAAATRLDMLRDGRPLGAAHALAWLHDIAEAEQVLAGVVVRDQFVAVSEVEQVRASAAVELARAKEDWQAVTDAAEAWRRKQAAHPTLGGPAGPDTVLPLALAELGRSEEARALAEATPLDCLPCVRVRAATAAALGEARLADHWWGEAVRMGPSLPQAEAEWARSLLERGRLDEAIAKASASARKGPRFGDPLVVWGEALVAKGDAKGAAAKFAAAAALTPKWGRLHLKWGEALAKMGKAEEARAHWKTAAGLHLTTAERAELARLQGA